MHRKHIHTAFQTLGIIACVGFTLTLQGQSSRRDSLKGEVFVTAPASYTYSNPSLLRKLFMGKNYREEWETPVTLPVFDIKAKNLRVTELGGGRQTKSLRLIDQDSVEWALRTIDKDVRPAIPKIIRNKFTLSIVQDMVSAAHPFGPLAIPVLAHAVGVQAAVPEFYYVPDDPAIGEYKDLFKDKVCLLEKRDLLPGVEQKSTEKMIQNLFEDHKNTIDQAAYLKARMLDMLIADWDRHYDQWKWAELDSNGKKTYLALPKDRDQAFFYSRGWLLKLIRLFGMKFTVGFTEKTDNLKKLNRVAWTLDRLLLNDLSSYDWQRIASSFQKDVQEATIREAVQKFPPDIYALNGETITQKLISRKNSIGNDIMKYYRFLAKEVTIYGTDQPEHFEFTGNQDSVTVKVYGVKSDKLVYYQRSFFPGETKKIHLEGLAGDDVFTCSKDLETQIRFEVDGGAGTNQYLFNNKLKVKVKDSKLTAESYFKKLRKPLRIREEEEKK